MKPAFSAALLLALLLAGALAGNAQELQAIPPGAIQLVVNPGFEGGVYPWAMGCSGGGSAEVDWHNPYTGLMHLVHWGPDTVCWTRQWFSLSACKPGNSGTTIQTIIKCNGRGAYLRWV